MSHRAVCFKRNISSTDTENCALSVVCNGSATFGRKTFSRMDISSKLNLDFATFGRIGKKRFGDTRSKIYILALLYSLNATFKPDGPGTCYISFYIMDVNEKCTCHANKK